MHVIFVNKRENCENYILKNGGFIQTFHIKKSFQDRANEFYRFQQQMLNFIVNKNEEKML